MSNKNSLYKNLDETFSDLDVLFHEHGIELLNCEECRPLKDKDLNRLTSLLREAYDIITENV